MLKNNQKNRAAGLGADTKANKAINSGIGRFFWMVKYTEGQEPGFIWTSLAAKTLDVVRVLLPLHLSSLVLKSIFRGEKMEYVFINVALLTAAYFLFTVLSGYFQRKEDYHYQRFMKKHQVNKALAVLDMDYGESERDDVQNELIALKRTERTVAMGIHTFQRGSSILFGNLICIAIGLYLVRNLFFSPAPRLAPLMNWGLNIGYIGLIFFLHYFAVKVDLKAMKMYADAIRNIFMKNHRYLQQYSELLFDYKAGKDIRFYSEALAKRYNEVYRIRQGESYNALMRFFSSAGAKRNLISTLISVLSALFVGYRSLLGCVAIADIFLCIGVLEFLFRGIEEMTSEFGKILSSDSLRKKFIHLFQDKKVWIEPDAQTDDKINTDGEIEAADETETNAESESLSVSALEPALGLQSGEKPNADGCLRVPTVEFRHVSFKYPNSDVLVLKDVNLKIYGNQKLALVGLNGSGKTTLIKLLLGLYRPTSGSILIDGEDSLTWSAERFISYFSAVFQDFKLFSLKIGENVAASEEFDGERVIDALEKTGLSEFCEKNGIDGYLYRDFEDGGIEISGGEAQKIAMSRAIYHGGKFFVLDEPTAALDPLSEYEIYTHFGEITSENPAIYISHRLSSCIFCDVVAVMDKGQIVQIGTHEQLLKDTGGVYAVLWNAQAKHYKNQSKQT